jgi:SnoaL-like polyketide cyclase
MSVEQVARDLITDMTDVEKTKAHLTPDAVASGGVLPQPMPAMEAFSLIGALKTAFPDLKFEVEDVTVNGNQAKVKARISGTNTGPLSLPMPGMPSNMPPTGKKVAAKDAFVVTVEGDKVSRLEVDSPDGGGLPALLAQLGSNMSGM